MSNTFINKGKFFDLHPDVIGDVTKFEKYDTDGNIVEAWERNEEGHMVDVTEKVKLLREIAEAEKALDKYIAEDVEEFANE